jgi:Rieske 2Fe-2S family protein
MAIDIRDDDPGIVAGVRPLAGLPREYYFSEDRFEWELDRLRAGQWLYFCHLSELPAKGDYRVRELLGESIVVLRGEGESVSAFFNVCRHRGSQICALPEGRVTQLTCPYHQWRYAIEDGSLLGAPGMPEDADFRFADWGLHRAQVDVWQGFVFVCLGDSALEPISVSLDRSARELLRTAPERTKVACTRTYDIRANWKVVLENSVECYHCPAGHPELCITMDRKAMFANLVDTYGASAGTKAGDVSPFLIVVDGGLPLKQGMKTLSMDGGYVCSRLLGEFGMGVEPPTPAFGAGFSMLPINTHFFFHADYGRVMHALPVSPALTRWVTHWMVHEDAVEGRDYDSDAMAYVFDATTREDVVLCEGVQRGISSRRYVPGPMSAEREPGIRAALHAYLTLMGEEQT